jgi:hypothetical protein
MTSALLEASKIETGGESSCGVRSRRNHDRTVSTCTDMRIDIG